MSTDILEMDSQSIWTNHIRWRLANEPLTEKEIQHLIPVLLLGYDLAIKARDGLADEVITALNSHTVTGVQYHPYDRCSCS